jgi:leucyl aminopeptidase
MCTYLDTLSSIFMKCKTQETYKMMSEVFIKDKSWQDTVQSFSIFCFKVDLISDSQKKAIQTTGKVNLVTIDEAVLTKEHVFRSLNSEEGKVSDVEKNLEQVRDNLKIICNQARSTVHYYECVNVLIKKAIDDAKNKSQNSQQNNITSEFADEVAEVGQEYEEDDYDNNEFNHAPSQEPELEADAENSNQNKLINYWNKVQKRVLYTYAFLIAPANGIILQYLENHGTNYCLNDDNDIKQDSTPLENQIVPTSFLLTTSILKFCDTLFT